MTTTRQGNDDRLLSEDELQALIRRLKGEDPRIHSDRNCELIPGIGNSSKIRVKKHRGNGQPPRYVVSKEHIAIAIAVFVVHYIANELRRGKDEKHILVKDVHQQITLHFDAANIKKNWSAFMGKNGANIGFRHLKAGAVKIAKGLSTEAEVFAGKYFDRLCCNFLAYRSHLPPFPHRFANRGLQLVSPPRSLLYL